MKTLAPAKLNLALAVLGRRPDGFHDLDSILVRVELADAIAVSVLPGKPTSRPSSDRLVLEDDGDCPLEGNLVLGATNLLRRTLRRPLPPLEVRLAKRIPVAAGLGGGSSDAAAALRVAAAAWQLPLADADLLRLAERLGSDVPFFAAAHDAARVRGRGEEVHALPAPQGRFGVVLVVPRGRLLTRDVFAALDSGDADERARTGEEAFGGARRSSAEQVTHELAEAFVGGVDAAALVGFAPRLREANDLWRAAAILAPDLPRVRDAVEATLHRPVLMSGSGPTLAALYASRAEAEDDARRLRTEPIQVLAQATVLATTGGSG